MKRSPTALFAVLGALALAFCQWLIYVYAPEEQVMGLAQKIFYIHLPLAWWGLISFGVSCIAGIAYLKSGKVKYDLLSASAVESHGKYYLFLTNRLPETKREIKLDLAGKRIRKIHTLTADSIQEVNTAVDKPILIRSREKNADDRITLPPGSITLLIAE